MTQFTPESLARLMTQVEREVLVEAAETAAIDPLLTTPRGETLDEVAEWLNFLSNMLVLAPAIDKIALDETIRTMLGATTLLPPGAIHGIRSTLGYFTTLLDKIGSIEDSIEVLKEGDFSTVTFAEIFNQLGEARLHQDHILGMVSVIRIHEEARLTKGALDRARRALTALL